MEGVICLTQHHTAASGGDTLHMCLCFVFKININDPVWEFFVHIGEHITDYIFSK